MSLEPSLAPPAGPFPAVPDYPVDFYSDEVILDPQPHYAAMRALGPVFWMSVHGNYAVARYDEVAEVVKTPEVFLSGRGLSADQVGCDLMRGNTVASDEPRHGLMRAAMIEPLLPESLEKVRDKIETAADGLVGNLIARGDFDAVAEFARFLPLTIVTELVGLPVGGRERMLDWGSAAFDLLGVQNERGRKALETMKEMQHYVRTRLTKDQVRPGSWTARIFDLEEKGKITSEMCPFLLRDYISPSLDTTISATGQLLYQLATNRDQWEELRSDPSLIPNAVNEAVRLASPARSFTRHVSQDYRLSGVTVPAGSRIMIVFAAANRDERKFADPHRFDVRRTGPGHLGFGLGLHTCAGMHLAKLEMESLLKAMVARVEAIEIGEPTILLNNTITGFAKLPAKFKAAAHHVDTRASSKAKASNWMMARIAECSPVAENILAFKLVPAEGESFPEFDAGSHIDVEVASGMIRQYSICSDPAEKGFYRLGVLREENSRGGSDALHRDAKDGLSIQISRPRNLFKLDESARRSVLLAGGIGITPILAMAHRLHAIGADFEVHYCVRSKARAAFMDEIAKAPFAQRVHLHRDDGPAEQRLDLPRLLSADKDGLHLYCCGPEGFLAYVKSEADARNWPEEAFHIEYFGGTVDLTGGAFRVVAYRSGKTFEIPSGHSILEALRGAGIEVNTSCESGTCGTCLVDVLQGEPDHRDRFQTPAQKATNSRVAVCCSRSISRTLVLDI